MTHPPTQVSSAPPPARPTPHEDTVRLDWLRDRLLQMPATYSALLGLPPTWASLRDAIDRTMAEEGGPA